MVYFMFLSIVSFFLTDIEKLKSPPVRNLLSLKYVIVAFQNVQYGRRIGAGEALLAGQPELLQRLQQRAVFV